VAEHDWAEVVIEDAVGRDGSFREIRLPTMVSRAHSRGLTADQDAIRRDVWAAVARGRLLEGPAELRCPAGHVAWAGPATEADAAKSRGCARCAAPVAAEELSLELTFTVPEAVAQEVASKQR